VDRPAVAIKIKMFKEFYCDCAALRRVDRERQFVAVESGVKSHLEVFDRREE